LKQAVCFLRVLRSQSA